MHRIIIRSTTLATLVAAGIIWGFGCNRIVDSSSPVKTLPDAAPTPTHVTATLDGQSVTLSWQVPDTTAVQRFRIYTTTSTGDSATLYDSTTSAVFTKTFTGLTANQTFYFAISTVGIGGLEGYRSSPLSVRTAVLSMSISGGAKYTNSRTVTVQLHAPSYTTDVILSEDSLFSGAVYQSYASERSFTLSTGDGAKCVYAKFVFADGVQSGRPLSDSIVLDTRAQIDTVYFSPTGTVLTTGNTVTFRMITGEPGGTAGVSFTGSGTIPLYDDGAGADSTANDGRYAGRYTVPLAMSITEGQVTGEFTDAAGNRASSRTAYSTLTIAPTPTAVSFTTVKPVSSSEINMSWSTAGSTDFASYRVYRAQVPAVTYDSTLIATITSASSTSFTDTALLENTLYYYRVYVYNRAGKYAGSDIGSARTLVNADPTAVVLAGNNDSTTAHLTWSQNADADFATYRLYRSTDTAAAVDTNDQLVVIMNSRGSTSYDDAALSGYTTLAYRLFVFDKQGKTTGSNKVIVVR